MNIIKLPFILTAGIVLFSISLLTKESMADTSASVTIQNFTFAPSEVDIAPGTTVIWHNNDSTSHTTTSDTGGSESWNSGTISPGQSFSYTFTTPGTYAYHCAIHPSMHGTVKVTQASQPMNMTVVITPAPTPVPQSSRTQTFSNTSGPEIYNQSPSSNESNEYKSAPASPRPASSTTPSKLPQTGPPVTALLLVGLFPLGLILKKYSL